MPRSRSNIRNSSRSSSGSPIRAPPPSPIPPAPTIENRTTSIANVVAEGFAWGTGISIAKNIFNSDEKKEVKYESNNEKKELNMNSDELWRKYDECTEQTDGSKCNDILIEDIN